MSAVLHCGVRHMLEEFPNHFTIPDILQRTGAEFSRKRASKSREREDTALMGTPRSICKLQQQHLATGLWRLDDLTLNPTDFQ